FVDDRAALAFTGDHLLSSISSNTEISSPNRSADGRARSRLRYLESLRRTADMPLRSLLTGHGPVVTGHRRLVQARLLEHQRRCEPIRAILADGAGAPTEARGLFDLTGRGARVTGGTRGLGLAIARTFASAGADLVIASRNEEACTQVAAEFESAGARALACPCHVGRWDDIE